MLFASRVKLDHMQQWCPELHALNCIETWLMQRVVMLLLDARVRSFTCANVHRTAVSCVDVLALPWCPSCAQGLEGALQGPVLEVLGGLKAAQAALQQQTTELAGLKDR